MPLLSKSNFYHSRPSVESNPTSQPEVSVETITPEEATAYLEANFKSNRDKTQNNITLWSNDMKAGRWKLSTDCIAFDVDGRLINGQNRLSAVEKANVPIQFLVARNFPADSINVLDIGKKRMMHERITIAGVPLTTKECSVIRNSMSRWESRTLGTIFFSQLRHDHMVVKVFKEHEYFLKLMERAGYMRQRSPGFFVVGALMIYVEGLALANKRSHIEDNNPLKRSLQFLEIVSTGTLEHLGAFKRERDGAALRLHQKYHEFQAKRKHWATWNCFVMTMKLAKKFDLQQNVNYVTEEGEHNPFTKGVITNYNGTTQSLCADLVDADYLPNQVRNGTFDEIVRTDDN